MTKIETTRRRLILELLAITLAIGTFAAYAQFSQKQTITYQLSSSVSMSLSPVSLGSFLGGTAATTQTFSNVLAFSVNTAGTYTISAALTVNNTVFSNFQLYIIAPGGQACQLQGGSAVSSMSTCSWTITSSTTYSETIIAACNDGISIPSGKIQPQFTVS